MCSPGVPLGVLPCSTLQEVYRLILSSLYQSVRCLTRHFICSSPDYILSSWFLPLIVLNHLLASGKIFSAFYSTKSKTLGISHRLMSTHSTWGTNFVYVLPKSFYSQFLTSWRFQPNRWPSFPLWWYYEHGQRMPWRSHIRLICYSQKFWACLIS